MKTQETWREAKDRREAREMLITEIGFGLIFVGWLVGGLVMGVH